MLRTQSLDRILDLRMQYRRHRLSSINLLLLLHFSSCYLLYTCPFGEYDRLTLTPTLRLPLRDVVTYLKYSTRLSGPKFS